MSQRFYVESLITSDRTRLDGAEAHHLIHVMRAKPGANVVLFDGSGQEFQAQIERVDRASVELRVLSSQSVDRESPRELTLAVALPKGDRQRWLIEKATELGVTRVVPLKTERGVAQPEDRALARLRRAVIEASKQCGRNVIMEIAPAAGLDSLLETTAHASCRLIAHPCGESLPTPGLTSPTVAAIGPEGGFTDAEVQRATSAGWQTVGLGPRILRLETAALMVAARLV